MMKSRHLKYKINYSSKTTPFIKFVNSMKQCRDQCNVVDCKRQERIKRLSDKEFLAAEENENLSYLKIPRLTSF